MDARHQSIEQETLNELINTINQFACENTDEFLANENLHEAIKLIAHHIYDYASLPVEIDEILSNKNLLSIDAVLLPTVDELADNHHKNFALFMKSIQDIISQPSHHTLNGFDVSIRAIINKFQAR